MSSSRLLASPEGKDAVVPAGGAGAGSGAAYGSLNRDVGSQPKVNQTPAVDKSTLTLRQRVNGMVEGDLDSWVEYGILALIMINVFLFLLGTVHTKLPSENYFPTKASPNTCISHSKTFQDAYPKFFNVCEAVSVAIFTVEYLARMWSCVELPAVAARGPVLGRLRYAVGFFALVDIVSILPFYITLVPGVPDASFTTAIRGFRLVRLFKADKYIAAFSLLGQVLYENGTLLIATAFYSILCLLLFSTILYFTERNNLDPDMACHFSSVPAAMFPTVLMLTGEYPLSSFTPLGSFFAAFVAVFAVATVGTFTGVISSGFVRALQEAKGKEFTVDA